LHFTESKDNVSLYWRKADPTLQSTGYLVEWYLQDQQFEKLQWMRLSSAESQAVITGDKEEMLTCSLQKRVVSLSQPNN
jgi:hypothetical protein